MPGIVRNGDASMGHASPTPNPIHIGTYNSGSDNVFVNGDKAIRIGDTLSCTDKAKVGSANVFINGKGVHRIDDETSGHGSWRPSIARTGSKNVIVNG